MADELDDIQTFDVDAPAFFEEHEAQHEARDTNITLTQDHTTRRQAGRRSLLDLRNARNAAAQLVRLPAPGESIHSIIRGNFDGWYFVPAVIELARRPCDELNIATLGFNQRNADALAELLNAGDIGRATFICSHFYKTHEGDVFSQVHDDLAARGMPALAIRCHAKILLFDFGQDGPQIVLEMSANLRSCRNLEQFVLTHDANLLRFHRRWMDALFRGANQ